MKRGIVLSAFLATFFINSYYAMALPYYFSGTVTEFDGVRQDPLLPIVAVGDIFYGFFSYNYETLPMPENGNSFDASRSMYDPRNPLFGLDTMYVVFFNGFFDAGGSPVLSSEPAIRISNNENGGDAFSLFTFTAHPTSTGAGAEFWLNLSDSSGKIFDDSSVPLSLNIDGFDSGYIQLTYFFRSSSPDCILRGRIDTLQTINAPVPEPTTMLLFGTGLAGLAAFGRKRRQ